MTDGKVVWDNAAGDFDWDRTTALPRSLAGAFDEEPRYIDLRWARTEEHLSLAHPRFRDAVADLAAPMHQRAKDELVGEDVRQHRRTVRLARSAIASLTVLTLLAAGAAVLYAGQRNIARSERDLARRQTALATSRLLAAEADARMTSQPILSALLSVTAYQTDDSVEARGSLLRQMERRRNVRAFLTGHRDGIRGVAFSRDGQILASGSLDSTVMLWDIRSHTRLATLKGHGGPVLQVAFDPDGRMLASASTDDTVRLWDIGRRTQIATLKGHASDAHSVAFSPDGRTLASGSTDGTVMLWDVRRHTRLATLKGHADWVTSLAFHPDGRTLACGVTDATVQLWDVPHRTRRGPALRLRRQADRGPRVFTSVAFGPGGRILAAGAGVRIGIWDLGRHPRMRALTGTHLVRGLALSPDGRTLVAGGDVSNVVDVWDLDQGTRTTTFTGHTDQVTDVAFDPDGRTVASASMDRSLILWDLDRTGRSGVADASGELQKVTFSADGRTLAWADETTIVQWDVARHARTGILRDESYGVATFALSADARTVVSAGDGDFISVWDVARPGHRDRLRGHTDLVVQVAFSPDGRMLASASSDGTVMLWDIARRSWLATLEGHAGEVLAVAFGPGGRTLVSGGDDETVIVWDVARRARLATLDAHGEVGGVAFSPDGRTLAAAFGSGVMLWDAEQGVELPGLNAVASSVVFSPDSKTLVAVDERAATVWDVQRRSQLASLDDVANSVAFSPNGRTLAAVGPDQTVMLRDFDVGSWQRHLCGIVGRNLTNVEWRDFLPDQPYRTTCSQ